jgi:hypothetical protein
VEFVDSPEMGSMARFKAKPLYATRHELQPNWTPLMRTACWFYPEKGKKSFKCRRFAFPNLVAFAMTIHKSHDGTFDQVAYDYHKGQEQQKL